MTSSRTLTFDVAKLRSAVVKRYDERIADIRDQIDPAKLTARRTAARSTWRKKQETKILDLARRIRSTKVTVSDTELDRFHIDGFYPERSIHDTDSLARAETQRDRALQLIDALHVSDDGTIALTATQAKEFLGVKL